MKVEGRHGAMQPLERKAPRRFERRGLAGLISWPAAEPAYLGSVIGAPRPPWCGGEDPRDGYLCDTYAFLLGRDTRSQRLRVVGG